MHDSRVKNTVAIPQGSADKVVTWEYEHGYEQKARVFVSHNRTNAASLGCRVRIYRVLGVAESLVVNAVLNNTAVEGLIDGPFDRIVVRYVQLGGAGGDNLCATLTARKEAVK